MRVCMCVRVHFIALPKALKSLPSGLSSSWRFDLNLSIWVANRPFLWYDFVCATVSMRLCVCESTSSLIKESEQPNQGEDPCCWSGLWSESISDDFKHWCPLLFKDASPPLLFSSLFVLLQASEKRGPGITSECLFHFVGRNEIGTEMWLSVLLDTVKDSVGRKSLRGKHAF